MVFQWEQYLFAFTVTLIAGLSTGLGSLIIYLKREISHNFIAAALGFSAGVMLFLSLFEILPASRQQLEGFYGEGLGMKITLLAFFGGMGLIAFINRLVPDTAQLTSKDWQEEGVPRRHLELYRAGIVTAVAMAIHNFPEGLASFMGALHDPVLGLTMAFAIAIHNIPEGISVAVPIYYATGSKHRAVLTAFLSGITEPLGAIIGYLLLRPFINEGSFGLIFAIVAGIMSYISFDELLPIANSYGDHKTVVQGLFTGMAVIALSLVIA